MNGDQSKIEIFAPFGAAYEVMKKILFQPFDFAKWCTIGFAAFMSGAWGSGLNFNFPSKGNWDFRSTSLIIALVVFVSILVFVLMWVASRGRFIFTDCVVRNRAAIVAPWREYRREANSFFLFSLAVIFLALVLLAVLALLIAVPLGLFSSGKGTTGIGAVGVFGLVFVGLLWVSLWIFFAVATQFIVPVMYRRRCRAWEAFVDVSKLILARPGPFILFVLFGIVLVMALLVGGTIVTCLTCCIAGLPYVSSVVLLPAFVWLLAFKLLFLRQFGPEYDVWATADGAVQEGTQLPNL